MTDDELPLPKIVPSREGDISFSGLGVLLTRRVAESHPDFDEGFGFQPSLDIYLRKIFAQAAYDGELVALIPAESSWAKVYAGYAGKEEVPITSLSVASFYAQHQSINNVAIELAKNDSFIARHLSTILKATDDIRDWRHTRPPKGVMSPGEIHTRKNMQTIIGALKEIPDEKRIEIENSLLWLTEIIADDRYIDHAIKAGTPMRFAEAASPEARTKRYQLYTQGL